MSNKIERLTPVKVKIELNEVDKKREIREILSAVPKASEMTVEEMDKTVEHVYQVILHAREEAAAKSKKEEQEKLAA